MINMQIPNDAQILRKNDYYIFFLHNGLHVLIDNPELKEPMYTISAKVQLDALKELFEVE